jgi:leader peptidase (prepilin peptidase)/N-methyltransferase
MIQSLAGSLEVLVGISFIAILVWISWTDLKSRIIPNISVAALLFLGMIHLICQVIQGQSIWPALFGLLIGLPFLPAWHLGKIGAGDIKLLIACGFFLGLPGGILILGNVLILSFIAALICFFRKQPLHIQIPFGPLICASSAIVYFVNIIFSMIII